MAWMFFKNDFVFHKRKTVLDNLNVSKLFLDELFL